MQKNINTVLFALMVACLLIAIHQSMKYGFAASYWLFMLTFLLMMIYQLRANKIKQKALNMEQQPQSKPEKPNQKNKK